MTQTDLANMALSKIGANLISSMDQQPLMATVITQTLGPFLRGHDWNFASKVIDLAPLVVTTPFPPGFTQAFDLPANFSRRISLSHGGVPLESVEYRILGNRVFTRYASLVLVYVRKEPPLEEWPPDFVEAFTTMMASRLAATLLKEPNVSAALRSRCLLEELPEAKKNDVEESPASLYVHDQVPAATSPSIRSRWGRGSWAVEPPPQ